MRPSRRRWSWHRKLRWTDTERIIASQPMTSARCIGSGSARSIRGAGEYRSVNIGKAGFQFAHAPLISGLMAELERGALRAHTPCREANDADVAQALAEVHAELILVHPFREGNGRLARLLALLMALQAGLPPPVLSPLSRRGWHPPTARRRSGEDRGHPNTAAQVSRGFPRRAR